MRGLTRRASERVRTTAIFWPSAAATAKLNLALVVGLQGRFDEAEKIASQELSPEQAQANVAYLRQMLAQQNAWSQLKDQDKAKPATN